MASEAIQGDERDAYVALGRPLHQEQGIAYGARALGRRSPHSSAEPDLQGEPRK